MKKDLPVYNIKHFKELKHGTDFYANYFVPHIKEHHIATIPHKHDFYLIVLFTAGEGTHEIDFTTYPIKPGTVFLISPGQMHNWSLSKDIDGYVFFHNKHFYDKGFITDSVKDYPFFSSVHNKPLVVLKRKEYQAVGALFKEIVKEYKADNDLKFEKLHALVTLIYVELSRQYGVIIKTGQENYLNRVRSLEELIDEHFKSKKFPYEYAAMMNMSEKHLNRISKACLNKTTSGLIAERIVLEAKRMLTHSKFTVSETAFELGYNDSSYFSRFFKKNTGKTPVEFMRHYQS